MFCFVGAAVCYSVTCLLACLGVRRSEQLANEYRERIIDLEDEVEDLLLVHEQLIAEGREVHADCDDLRAQYKHLRLALEAAVEERNDLRARLQRNQPRSAAGKYVKEGK